jgi:hypothetical protein
MLARPASAHSGRTSGSKRWVIAQLFGLQAIDDHAVEQMASGLCQLN